MLRPMKRDPVLPHGPVRQPLNVKDASRHVAGLCNRQSLFQPHDERRGDPPDHILETGRLGAADTEAKLVYNPFCKWE